jgi:hypothetical protein
MMTVLTIRCCPELISEDDARSSEGDGIAQRMMPISDRVIYNSADDASSSEGDCVAQKMTRLAQRTTA